MFGHMISDVNPYIISQFVPAVVYIWLFTFMLHMLHRKQLLELVTLIPNLLKSKSTYVFLLKLQKHTLSESRVVA